MADAKHHAESTELDFGANFGPTAPKTETVKKLYVEAYLFITLSGSAWSGLLRAITSCGLYVGKFSNFKLKIGQKR